MKNKIRKYLSITFVLATKKEYSLDVAGLHQKYPTLHDVYFGNC